MSHHIPTMRTVRALRAALGRDRLAGRSIGLVPTMGALHEGHLSLIRQARERCDVVVVSVFVNPSQFDRRADLERYPRQEARDAELAAQAGADLLFAPSVEEVYPAGFATQVQVHGITDRLEGASRGPEHFRGVATVVAKLLNMVGPQVAFLGQKDAQQVLVIRRLVADLSLPVEIAVGATVREADGLALSSRNTQLNSEERERAVALYTALQAAAQLVADGERAADVLLGAARLALAALDVEPEYLSLVDTQTLEDVSRLEEPALLAVAAYVGPVRLIDNAILDPSSLATDLTASTSGPYAGAHAASHQAAAPTPLLPSQLTGKGEEPDRSRETRASGANPRFDQPASGRLRHPLRRKATACSG